MKVMKILGVVFGALLLLTGIALLAGSAVVGAGQGALDDELAKQGFAGPVRGTVTSIDQAVFTVSYTDNQGAARTGSGPVLSGTGPPSIGEEVNVYYSTADPSNIAIVDLPGGGDLSGIAGALRTAAIVCLIVGGVLLLAGIIGLVTGRKARAAVTAGPGGAPPPVPGQQYPPQQYPPQPGQQYPPQQYPPQPGQQYPPQSGQQYPPQPGQQYPPQPGQQQMPPPPQEYPPAS